MHPGQGSIFTLLSGMRPQDFAQLKMNLTVPRAPARPALMDASASAWGPPSTLAVVPGPAQDDAPPPPPARPPPRGLPPAPVQNAAGNFTLPSNRTHPRQLPDVALPDPAGGLRHPAPQVTLPAYYCTYCTVYCTQYVYCMYCTSTVQYVEHSTPGTILRTSISYNIVCI